MVMVLIMILRTDTSPLVCLFNDNKACIKNHVKVGGWLFYAHQ